MMSIGAVLVVRALALLEEALEGFKLCVPERREEVEEACHSAEKALWLARGVKVERHPQTDLVLDHAGRLLRVLQEELAYME